MLQDSVDSTMFCLLDAIVNMDTQYQGLNMHSHELVAYLAAHSATWVTSCSSRRKQSVGTGRSFFWIGLVSLQLRETRSINVNPKYVL